MPAGKIVSGDSEGGGGGGGGGGGITRRLPCRKESGWSKPRVHELLLDANVFINVPILKHHSSSMVTIGMKNLMGVVMGPVVLAQERSSPVHCGFRFIPQTRSHRVVDAYNVMKQNGPRGVSVGDVVAMKFG